MNRLAHILKQQKYICSHQENRYQIRCSILLGPIHTKDARFCRLRKFCIHLNGARWRTTFFRRRNSRCLQNLVRQLVPPKTRVFSAAEILLRIYQNPIHLNGTRWRTRFWRQREVRRRKNVIRQRAHLNVWGFDISAAEFPQPKKTRVFGVNMP